MVGSVVYGSMNTKYRESAKDTALSCFFDTFADCRNVFLGNRTADNLGIKLEQFFSVGIHRLESDFTVTVLTTSTGLLSILGININSLCEGFLVSNLRSTYVSFHLKFTKKSVYDDFQMELTHTCDNGLSCFLICMSTEGRIFFCKFCKSFTHLALSCLSLGLDSKLNNGFREFHGLKNYRMLFVTDGVTCCCKLKSNCCRNITGVNFVKLGSLVCVHLKDTSNTFLFIFCRIQYIGTGVHSTGINSEECKLSYEGVSHDLECKSCERLFIR